MARKEHPFNEECAWVYEQLIREGSVRFDAFNGKFKHGRDRTRWSHVCNAMFGLLPKFGAELKRTRIKTDGGQQPCLQMTRRPELQGFSTDHFKSDQDVAAKVRIGATVALYLKSREDRHVLMGSGSTVYHAGVQARAVAGVLGPYPQEFWTFNPILVAEWCRKVAAGTTSHVVYPVDQVYILGGTVSTKHSRYTDVELREEPFPLFVLGADGVHYDGKKASLYAHDKPVGKMSDQIIRKATHAVICCLASEKLKYHPEEGQNVSHFIRPPGGAVKRYLVTDRLPEAPAVPNNAEQSVTVRQADGEGTAIPVGDEQPGSVVKALGAEGWTIIASPFDFPEVQDYLKRLDEDRWNGISNYLAEVGIRVPTQFRESAGARGVRKGKAPSPTVAPPG